MTVLSSLSLRYQDGQLLVLDQELLPQQEVWITCESPEHMASLIRSLKVRGAPLIGVAAVLSLAKYRKDGATLDEVAAAAAMLRKARPTAVNLMTAIDRITKDLKNVIQTAEAIFAEDVALCDAIGKHGAALIQDGDSILTHCNAGGLATAGIGTAIGVIRRSHEQGKRIHVFVDETRPLLQGGRLTAWELEKLGIPYTLICDNMAAALMRQGKIQKIVVGADRIAINGDFANKIGTYGVAVAANYHRIPFYVAAPWTTVDQSCTDGDQIPIEERSADEVRGVSGSFGKVCWSPTLAKTFNPAFDVTPAALVEGIILDTGVFGREDIKRGALTGTV